MRIESSLFQRLLLPGFAFKAVVIGGGYATGRELAEFFIPSGPLGGLLGMFLTMALWSGLCALTFLFAFVTASLDYRTFFHHLLGRFWFLFEVAFLLTITLILSVFGAAAGEIGASMFGAPQIAGTIALMASISAAVAFGNSSVERLFKYVTLLLYGVYAVFFVLAMWKLGDSISERFTWEMRPDWWLGGVKYATYNLVGAVVILPVVRHMQRRRDAVVSGLLCGPLAILPAVIFFIGMIAHYPEIGSESLPSNLLLASLGYPGFHMLFQIMIFAALLESGAGLVHAFNERLASVAAAAGRPVAEPGRLASALALLATSIFLASGIGLVPLIASGYSGSAYVFLAIYILPLVTIGTWKLWNMTRRKRAASIRA